MRFSWFILLLMPMAVWGQCTNRWSFNMNGGANAAKVTAAALNANTTGNGLFTWASYLSGVTEPEANTTVTWSTDAAPLIPMSFDRCGTTVVWSNTAGVVGFDAASATASHWRITPTYASTSAVATIWVMFTGPETADTFNLDIFSLFARSGSTNFVNCNLHSRNGSYSLGLEDPGGEDPGDGTILGLRRLLWYRLTIAKNIRGTNYLMVHDSATNLIGIVVSTITELALENTGPLNNLGIGITSVNGATEAGHHLYYYGGNLYAEDNSDSYWPPPLETPPPLTPTLTAACSPAQLSDGRINLSWNRSTNASGYIIQRSVGGGLLTTIAGVDANTLTYADTGLVVGTAYDYAVLGTNIYYPTASGTVSTNTFCFRQAVGSRFSQLRL